MASTSSPQLKKYHVFLSFRGEDTRELTQYIFAELKKRTINAFMDDFVLERGTNLSEGFKLAIEQSRLSIVIISKNYASSRWCLDELAHIFRCKKESDNIMPIFYGVEPGDVRHQRGSFAEHFIQHEKKLGKGSKEVLEWRDAMKKLGNLAGWKLSTDRSKTELIEEIVDAVWRKIHSAFGRATRAAQKSDKIVKKINNIDSLLKLDSNDTRFIGIWGRDEIGIKATADLVHNRIRDNFELSIFVRDIRRKTHDISLVYVQTQLLKELNGRSEKVPSVDVGNSEIEKSVRNKKVLLILDDVDSTYNTTILCGKKDWYGCGSRIIFTSMDRDSQVKHDGLLEGLSAVEARELNYK
ncbi:disease resistance protein Roq1-like [Argentina anserina]|uniref:disease resistance protein Roq1-like n=1 Tax=Argentina anserina TaxID=57926 RepID=UPI0021763A19|nr:disease resistance protein Roq1-like [Potentilla anserina]